MNLNNFSWYMALAFLVIGSLTRVARSAPFFKFNLDSLLVRELSITFSYKPLECTQTVVCTLVNPHRLHSSSFFPPPFNKVPCEERYSLIGNHCLSNEEIAQLKEYFLLAFTTLCYEELTTNMTYFYM